MKRTLLLLTLVVFGLSACSNSGKSRRGSLPISGSVSNSNTKSGGSTVAPSSIPDIPPIDEFGFSPNELTVDLKDGHTGYLKCFYPDDEDADIDWIIPHSSIIRLEKVKTNSGDINSFQVLNIGDITIEGKVGENSVYCNVHVVNTTSRKTSGKETITIYAVNDYHGQVSETFSLKHFGTYIKQKVSNANTLFLDQGDTWQGTLESNYNRGRMITDVYNAAGMSARTVGNHDFDWKISALVNNTNAAYHGYSTPVLAANVYDFNWNTKEVGTTQQSQIGKEYVTFTLESGLKVGVVGVIGSSCVTDINTPNIMTISFTNVINKIKQISDVLRVNEECDIVIASMHEGYYTALGTELRAISPVSHQRYIDLGLNGHSHQEEIYGNDDDVVFAQFGSNNETIGKISLTYDYTKGKVTKTDAQPLSTFSLVDEVSTLDPEISSIVDRYNEETSTIGAEVLTTKLEGYFSRFESLPNIVCKAMYEEAINEGYDVSYAMCNYGRTHLNGPVVTYSSLFESVPFDNVCYIVELTGEDALNEIQYNNSIFIYRGNNEDAMLPLDPSPEKIYTFVIIDYIALHANINREYDYIPSVNPINYLEKGGESYCSREVVADYIRSQDGSIKATDYSSNLPCFDGSKVTQPLS